MLITSEHLKGACQNQIDLFNETFPVGAEFNKTNWDLALSVGLQVNWMARFLNEPALKIYKEAAEPAWKIYEESRISTWEIYRETTEPARMIYEETTEPAWKIYKEAAEPAWKIYNEAKTTAWKIYDEATASALFNALEQQFNVTK